MNKNLEKTGPFAVLIATAWCTACFPAIAWVATAMWFGFMQWFEWTALKFVQFFIVLSMIFSYFTYKRNKFKPIFIITILSWIVMLWTFYMWLISIYYIAMVFLIIASIWNFIIDRKLPSCKDWACEVKCEVK